VSIGAFYLLAKLLVRTVAHSAAAVEINLLQAIAWFGIDLELLSLSLSGTTGAHTTICKSDLQVFAWYSFCVFLLVVSILLYVVFLRAGKQQPQTWRAASVRYGTTWLIWI